MKKFYEMMFTRDETNLGRQTELDITKTLCIFFMIVLHTVECFASGNSEVSGSFSNLLMYYFAGFTGAGTFMLCMGIGFGYTKHSEPKDFIKRGAMILLFSYILNVARAFVYIFIFYPTMDASLFEKFFYIGFEVFNVDIMQFAGLALMTFGLFKLVKMKPWQMFAIAFSLSLGATLFIILHGQVTTGSIIGDSILSLLFPMWYVEEGTIVSFFSLVCYLIFPTAGYCISFYYKKIKNKNIVFGIVLGLAAITIVTYILINPIENHAGLFREGDLGYYHMYTWDALVDIITSMGLIALCYFVSLILPKLVLNLCHDISKNINKVYCISWVILVNGLGIYELSLREKGLEIPEISDWILVLMGLAVFVVSYVIAHYYSDFKEKMKNKKAIA